MKILSLGAAGFIGSHLTHRLLQDGHHVTAVDLNADKIAEHLEHPRLHFIQQDSAGLDGILRASSEMPTW